MPWAPFVPVIPCIPCRPCRPWVPVIPWAPLAPISPFWPLSPLSPVATNDTKISSLFVNGLFADAPCAPISNFHQPGLPVWSVKESILNKVNSLGSNLLEILTCPNTADVTFDIVVRKESILVPLSSSADIDISMEDACVPPSLSNLTNPVPGSAIVVEVEKV